MKYHKQIHLHVPDAYPSGSCYPTVYACLLDLELDKVPYFNLLYFPLEQEKTNLEKMASGFSAEGKKEYLFESKGLWNRVREMWLVAQGYTEDYIVDMDKFLAENPEMPYIASGISPRGVGHVVIFKGGKMIHDPHPSNSGLVEIHSYMYLRDIHGSYDFDRYYKK